MAIVRFLMLLSLVAWLGGIIFFSFVVAPTVFSVLPTRHLAGSVVTRSLAALHWMGLVSGVVFAITSMIWTRATHGAAQPFAARHIVVYAMLALTLASQFGVSPRMQALRAGMGQIDDVAQDDPRRVEFNQLHAWSTRLEGGVFFLGLALLFLTARRLS
ncbi:MAG: DUF4149 domain-containing protein [Acidobacteriia bacterium]|nr:DUF4149 domain-containing protein [Terriglobia bacterium]